MQAVKLVLGLLAALVASVAAYEKLSDRRFIYGQFPSDFAWSSATSAYQIEGGWNADGKGRNMWDKFTEENGTIADGSDGKVACDSYHNYVEDVQLLKALKVKHYRFSLSWTRLLPDGTPGTVNSDGVEYYNKLIDELLKNGIEPQVTIYHWDLPEPFDAQGGWLNSSIVDWFYDYADFVYKTFGSKVKFWITFNEPLIHCTFGYAYGAHAPGVRDTTGTNAYKCGWNQLRAHARAYRLYDEKYRKLSEGGKCGITLNVPFSQANDSSSSSDLEAADRAMQFDMGWFAHPIFSSSGDYPTVMKDRVAERSRQQNLTESRLPAFTSEEIDSLKGSSDFFGLNFYTGGNVVDNPHKDDPWDPSADPSFDDDKGILAGARDPSWTPSASSWLYSTPELMRALLVWIKDQYNNPEVFITENGFSDLPGVLHDDTRVEFYRAYLNNVLQAIIEDGCKVKGYTAWSLLDNFEWASGYGERFGLHYVNFSDPKRPRVAKDSARFYTKIIEDNGFVEAKSAAPAVYGVPYLCLAMLIFVWIKP